MRITRRLFLSLPAMVPFARLPGVRSDVHHFSYDHVIGTSLDLVVWTSNPETARSAEAAALEEVHRLTAILNTRDPHSEISRLSARLMVRSGLVSWPRSRLPTTIGLREPMASCLCGLEARIRLAMSTRSARPISSNALSDRPVTPHRHALRHRRSGGDGPKTERGSIRRLCATRSLCARPIPGQSARHACVHQPQPISET
jgi:hypothetical protein